MLDWLMTFDPAERPTVADALGHKWLSMEQKGPKPSDITLFSLLSSPENQEIHEAVEHLVSQEGLKEQGSAPHTPPTQAVLEKIPAKGLQQRCRK